MTTDLEMEQQQQQQQQEPPPRSNAVKLPPFWVCNPAAWFATAEGAFELRGIVGDRAKFFNVLTALPETTVSLIADLVEANPLPENAFQALKDRLLVAHQLTDIQRVEQLHALPPLGAQRPSELLAEMIRLCPRGAENNCFFNCLFLTKLPRELRILLSDAPMEDKQALGARADQIWSHNSRLAHDQATVAALADLQLHESDQEEPAVAAVRGSASRGGFKGGRDGKKNGAWQQKKKNPAGAASSLCKPHRIYKEQAWTCIPPCSWQGN